MKKFFVISCFLLFSRLPGAAQASPDNQVPVDSILQTLKRISLILDEKNYTRIPNKEFDDKINQTVSRDIDNRWKNMLAWAAGIGGALLIFGFNYLRKEQTAKLHDETKKEVDKKSVELEEKLKIRIDNIENDIDIKVENYFLKNFKEISDNELRKISLAFDGFKAKMVAIDTVLTDLVVERSKNVLDDEKSTKKEFEDIYNDLMRALQTARDNNNKDGISKIIGQLSRASYYTKKETEFQAIVDEFRKDKDIEILEGVYINIASSLFYTYNAAREEQIKQKAFSYLTDALRRVEDYGEALGLKLEFLMLDYANADTDTVLKEKIKKEAKMILNQVLNSTIAPSETISRFDRVKGNKTEGRCIKQLEELFPDEMSKMRGMTGTHAN